MPLSEAMELLPLAATSSLESCRLGRWPSFRFAGGMCATSSQRSVCETLS